MVLGLLRTHRLRAFGTDRFGTVCHPLGNECVDRSHPGKASMQQVRTEGRRLNQGAELELEGLCSVAYTTIMSGLN